MYLSIMSVECRYLFFNVFVDNDKGYQKNFHGTIVKAKTIQVIY